MRMSTCMYDAGGESVLYDGDVARFITDSVFGWAHGWHGPVFSQTSVEFVEEE